MSVVEYRVLHQWPCSLMVVLLLVKDEVWGSTHRICGIKDCLVNLEEGGGGGGEEEYRVLHQLIC